MEIRNTQVFGFESALRGMRNPMNSWSKSDSMIDSIGMCKENTNINKENFILGIKDSELSQKLTRAGGEHCKQLRLIQVWFDLEAPRYMHQELDTYKHLEKISCSTIHKLLERELKLGDFENGDDLGYYLVDSVVEINRIKKEYMEAKKSKDTKLMNELLVKAKSILPESFLQLRTVNTNYQQLLNIYRQRKHHKLPVWREFCEWIERLPYFTELTNINTKGDVK